MSYCTYCGTKNREGALFCKSCGKPMSEPQEDNNVEQPAEEQAVVEKPVVVEEQIAEEPIAPQPSVVEIPIETPTAAPKHAEPQPVVQPVVQPVTPQPAPKVEPVQTIEPVQENAATEPKVTAEQEPKVAAEPEPKVNSAQASSDLMERVSKPRNKGKIITILLIPLFLALIGIGVGAFFLFKAANTVKEEVNSTMETINNDNDQSEDNAVVYEDEAAEEEAEETEAAEEDNTADYATEAKASSSASLSTKAKPAIADFQGWFINGAMKSGKPDGVNTLSSLSDISGSWKAFLFLDPSNRNGEKAQTFATITFDGTNDKIKVYLKRFYTHFFNGNEIMDESSEAPDFFSAKWKSGQLIASGVGSFIISDFWQQGSKQYAIGTFTTQDGISASMGLVRP